MHLHLHFTAHTGAILSLFFQDTNICPAAAVRIASRMNTSLTGHVDVN